eukprot:gene2215-1380_t
MEGCEDTLEALDATLEEIHGALQLIIEQESVPEKKKMEIASRPAVKLARSQLAELRAEIRRVNDPAARAQLESEHKDREMRLRNYASAIKENVFPARNAASSESNRPKTYAALKAQQLMGAGGADGSQFQNAEQVLQAATNMQEDALQAIERTERLQYVTEQSGRMTLEEVRLQTERIYQIDEELEDIHGQLDHASRDVKWFFRQLAGDKCLLSLFGIFMVAVLVMLFVIIWKRREKGGRGVMMPQKSLVRDRNKYTYKVLVHQKGLPSGHSPSRSLFSSMALPILFVDGVGLLSASNIFLFISYYYETKRNKKKAKKKQTNKQTKKQKNGTHIFWSLETKKIRRTESLCRYELVVTRTHRNTSGQSDKASSRELEEEMDEGSAQMEPQEEVVGYSDVMALCVRQGIMRTLLAPMDRVKFIMESQMELVRLAQASISGPRGEGGRPHRSAQASGTHRVGSSSHLTTSTRSSSSSRASRAPFTTSWQAVRHLRRHEGVRNGLWRGNGMQLGSIAAQSMCHYHLSDPVMRTTYTLLAPESTTGHIAASYCAFLCAGLVCAFVPYPLEFLRFHLAVDVKGLFPLQQRGVVRAAPPGGPTAAVSFNNNYRVPRGFAFLRHHPVLRECPQYCFTGFGLYALGSAAYFLSHRFFSSAMERTWMRQTPDPYEVAQTSLFYVVLTDAAATLLATTIAHPVDLVRRRQMLAVVSLDRPTRRYASAWACAQRVAAEEGLRGFFRGLPISLGRMVVLAGVIQGVGWAESILVRWRYAAAGGGDMPMKKTRERGGALNLMSKRCCTQYTFPIGYAGLILETVLEVILKKMGTVCDPYLFVCLFIYLKDYEQANNQEKKKQQKQQQQQHTDKQKEGVKASTLLRSGNGTGIHTTLGSEAACGVAAAAASALRSLERCGVLGGQHIPFILLLFNIVCSLLWHAPPTSPSFPLVRGSELPSARQTEGVRTFTLLFVCTERHRASRPHHLPAPQSRRAAPSLYYYGSPSLDTRNSFFLLLLFISRLSVHILITHTHYILPVLRVKHTHTHTHIYIYIYIFTPSLYPFPHLCPTLRREHATIVMWLSEAQRTSTTTRHSRDAPPPRHTERKPFAPTDSCFGFWRSPAEVEEVVNRRPETGAAEAQLAALLAAGQPGPQTAASIAFLQAYLRQEPNGPSSRHAARTPPSGPSASSSSSRTPHMQWVGCEYWPHKSAAGTPLRPPPAAALFRSPGWTPHTPQGVGASASTENITITVSGSSPSATGGAVGGGSSSRSSGAAGRGADWSGLYRPFSLQRGVGEEDEAWEEVEERQASAAAAAGTAGRQASGSAALLERHSFRWCGADGRRMTVTPPPPGQRVGGSSPRHGPSYEQCHFRRSSSPPLVAISSSPSPSCATPAATQGNAKSSRAAPGVVVELEERQRSCAVERGNRTNSTASATRSSSASRFFHLHSPPEEGNAVVVTAADRGLGPIRQGQGGKGRSTGPLEDPHEERWLQQREVAQTEKGEEKEVGEKNMASTWTSTSTSGLHLLPPQHSHSRPSSCPPPSRTMSVAPHMETALARISDDPSPPIPPSHRVPEQQLPVAEALYCRSRRVPHVMFGDGTCSQPRTTTTTVEGAAVGTTAGEKWRESALDSSARDEQRCCSCCGRRLRGSGWGALRQSPASDAGWCSCPPPTRRGRAPPSDPPHIVLFPPADAEGLPERREAQTADAEERMTNGAHRSRLHGDGRHDVKETKEGGRRGQRDRMLEVEPWRSPEFRVTSSTRRLAVPLLSNWGEDECGAKRDAMTLRGAARRDGDDEEGISQSDHHHQHHPQRLHSGRDEEKEDVPTVGSMERDHPRRSTAVALTTTSTQTAAIRLPERRPERLPPPSPAGVTTRPAAWGRARDRSGLLPDGLPSEREQQQQVEGWEAVGGPCGEEDALMPISGGEKEVRRAQSTTTVHRPSPHPQPYRQHQQTAGPPLEHLASPSSSSSSSFPRAAGPTGTTRRARPPPAPATPPANSAAPGDTAAAMRRYRDSNASSRSASETSQTLPPPPPRSAAHYHPPAPGQGHGGPHGRAPSVDTLDDRHHRSKRGNGGTRLRETSSSTATASELPPPPPPGRRTAVLQPPSRDSPSPSPSTAASLSASISTSTTSSSSGRRSSHTAWQPSLPPHTTLLSAAGMRNGPSRRPSPSPAAPPPRVYLNGSSAAGPSPPQTPPAWGRAASSSASPPLAVAVLPPGSRSPGRSLTPTESAVALARAVYAPYSPEPSQEGSDTVEGLEPVHRGVVLGDHLSPGSAAGEQYQQRRHHHHHHHHHYRGSTPKKTKTKRNKQQPRRRAADKHSQTRHRRRSSSSSSSSRASDTHKRPLTTTTTTTTRGTTAIPLDPPGDGLRSAVAHRSLPLPPPPEDSVSRRDGIIRVIAYLKDRYALTPHAEASLGVDSLLPADIQNLVDCFHLDVHAIVRELREAHGLGVEAFAPGQPFNPFTKEKTAGGSPASSLIHQMGSSRSSKQGGGGRMGSQRRLRPLLGRSTRETPKSSLSEPLVQPPRAASPPSNIRKVPLRDLLPRLRATATVVGWFPPPAIEEGGGGPRRPRFTALQILDRVTTYRGMEALMPHLAWKQLEPRPGQGSGSSPWYYANLTDIRSVQVGWQQQQQQQRQPTSPSPAGSTASGSSRRVYRCTTLSAAFETYRPYFTTARCPKPAGGAPSPCSPVLLLGPKGEPIDEYWLCVVGFTSAGEEGPRPPLVVCFQQEEDRQIWVGALMGIVLRNQQLHLTPQVERSTRFWRTELHIPLLRRTAAYTYIYPICLKTPIYRYIDIYNILGLGSNCGACVLLCIFCVYLVVLTKPVSIVIDFSSSLFYSERKRGRRRSEVSERRCVTTISDIVEVIILHLLIIFTHPIHTYTLGCAAEIVPPPPTAFHSSIFVICRGCGVGSQEKESTHKYIRKRTTKSEEKVLHRF